MLTFLFWSQLPTHCRRKRTKKSDYILIDLIDEIHINNLVGCMFGRFENNWKVNWGIVCCGQDDKTSERKRIERPTVLRDLTDDDATER